MTGLTTEVIVTVGTCCSGQVADGGHPLADCRFGVGAFPMRWYRQNQRYFFFALGAAWLLVFAYMVGQADQHNRPLTTHITEITFLGLKLSEMLLVFVTGLLWISTRDLVVANETTAKRQLRAYLSVEAGIYFRQNKRLRFEFRPNLINTGQTPAKRVRIVSNMNLASPQIPSNFIFTLTPSAVVPTSEGSIGRDKSLFHAAVFPRRLTRQELREVFLGRKIFHFWGQVTYLDVFDDPQFTNFSFIIFVANKRSIPVWHNTERHNDAS